MSIDTTMSDRKVCMSDMPADLMAVSSLLSPRFPKVMRLLRRMANGKACGTSIRAMYHRNWAMTSKDSPLPISTLIYLQRNCIISTNWQMKNVPTKRRPNCLTMNMSSFLIRKFINHHLLALWAPNGAIHQFAAKVMEKYKKPLSLFYFIALFSDNYQFPNRPFGRKGHS